MAGLISKFGNKWIIVGWSFPLLVFTIILFSQRDKSKKLFNEKRLLMQFIIANAILLVSLIAALATANYFNSRILSLMVAVIVWGMLSWYAMSNIN